MLKYFYTIIKIQYKIIWFLDLISNASFTTYFLQYFFRPILQFPANFNYTGKASRYSASNKGKRIAQSTISATIE